MTKCKHDDGDCYCDQYNAEMTMSDSLQKIIDTISSNITALTAQGEHDIAGLLLQYKDRLETLQKQPVAWMEKHGHILKSYFVDAEMGQYTIPLIRGD